MKIWELAKELNIESSVIIDYITSLGEVTGNHFAVLTEEQILKVRAQFPKVESASEKRKTTARNKETTVAIKKEQRKYVAGDMIPCRCVKNNKVVMMSIKSGIRYTWLGFGDENDVDYADLIGWKSSKQPILFAPKIMIEDPELLEQWSKDFKDKYEMFLGVTSPNDYFDVSDADFESIFTNAPKSIQTLIASAATALIKENKFTSVLKCKTIDKVLGTILTEFLA